MKEIKSPARFGKRAALAALVGKRAPSQPMGVDEARRTVQLGEAYMQILGCMPFELFARCETALARLEMHELGIKPGDKYQDEAIRYTDADIAALSEKVVGK